MISPSPVQRSSRPRNFELAKLKILYSLERASIDYTNKRGVPRAKEFRIYRA